MFQTGNALPVPCRERFSNVAPFANTCANYGALRCLIWKSFWGSLGRSLGGFLEVALGVSLNSFLVLPGGHLEVFRARREGRFGVRRRKTCRSGWGFQFTYNTMFHNFNVMCRWVELVVMYFEKHQVNYHPGKYHVVCPNIDHQITGDGMPSPRLFYHVRKIVGIFKCQHLECLL